MTEWCLVRGYVAVNIQGQLNCKNLVKSCMYRSERRTELTLEELVLLMPVYLGVEVEERS